MEKELFVKKLMQLELEKQMRCGDGTGKILSHSVNCLCDETNAKIESLKREMVKTYQKANFKGFRKV